MTLTVSLTDEGLTARIAEDSIKEDGDSYYIGTVSMYQYMGSSYLDDKEGYMFIPDGNGALVYLDDKEGRFSSGYSASIRTRGSSGRLFPTCWTSRSKA